MKCPNCKNECIKSISNLIRDLNHQYNYYEIRHTCPECNFKDKETVHPDESIQRK